MAPPEVRMERALWALVGTLLLFAVLVVARDARPELIHWRDPSPRPVEEIRVEWPGGFEVHRVACTSDPCVLVTQQDLPPGVPVVLRARYLDSSWSPASDPHEYWQCRDVAGADGVVGIRDMAAAWRLGGVSGFIAWRRMFGDRCS